MRRAATGFAVFVPAGWFLLLGAVYWLGWAATVRRTVRALRLPVASRVEDRRAA